MDEVLTIGEIEARYAGEWVLLADPETDEQFQIIRGRVLCHSSDREELDEKALTLHPRHSAYLWVGAMPEDEVFLI